MAYYKDSLEDGAFLLKFLTGIDYLAHLAGRAHVLCDESRDPLTAFRAINCDATLELARTAQRAGVKRFFVSSIGVNGLNYFMSALNAIPMPIMRFQSLRPSKGCSVSLPGQGQS